MACGGPGGTATSGRSTSMCVSCVRSSATPSHSQPCGAWGTDWGERSMTRRLTVTMVAVVAGALLVAGFGSLLLIRAQSRRDTVNDLRKQAQGIAQLVDDIPARNSAAATALRQRILQRVLKLTDQEVIRYSPAGQTLDPLPAGVSASDLDIPKLQQGQTVSGVNGGLAFAAAPGTTARGAPFALVLTRNVRVGGGAALWLLVAGGAALIVAVAVAANLGRRLTKPLREAEQATRRIAAGDLAARRFSLDWRATDGCWVINATAEGFRPAAEAAGVRLALDVPARAALVAAADPDRLAQVVANLVENALDFASGRITVGTGRADDLVELWVEDDGPGIEPDDIPHVFDRFYTVSRAAKRHVGSGLGLAIVPEPAAPMGAPRRAGPGTKGGARLGVALS